MNNELMTGVAPVLETVETTPISIEVKPYTLRKLKSVDLFPVLNIMKKIGVKKFTEVLRNEQTIEIFKKLNEEKTEQNADLMISMGAVLFEVAEIVISGLADCEQELFNLLSQVSGLPIAQIKEFDIEVFTGMIIDLIKENMDFIKAVSKYLG